MANANKLTGAAFPTLVSVDPDKPAVGQKGLMNRWHSDTPFVASVNSGDIFHVECVDWTGNQVKNTDNADDIANIDLTGVHYLSGPFEIKGSKPGDMLKVDILEVAPFPHRPWGYTGTFEHDNGGGLLAKEFGEGAYHASKAIWDLQGVYATSRHIPGVRFAGIPHPGLAGTLPSKELLEVWNTRERGLIEAHKVDGKEAVPPVALPPMADGAYVGQEMDEELRKKIYAEGARTIPPREHGGNVDIKNLSRGSSVYFPVFVEGAGLAIGDLHFSQGDGEISFCGAIEMAGIVTLGVTVIPGGIAKMGNQTMPMFLPSPVDPMYSSKIIFQGIGVDLHGNGEQKSMDATQAYKEAAKNCILYLQKLGYSRQQAILLMSAAPMESHVASLVDYPNACVTMGLPTGIFDVDIMPGVEGPKRIDRGQAAIRSDGKV